MKNVIIYRHQLFKPSEGFIFQQTQHLSSFRPIFSGRVIQGRLPEAHLTIETLKKAPYFKLIKHVLLRDHSVLYSSLKNQSPALIHAHFGVEGVYALPLAQQLKIPLITTFHGFDASCHAKALLFSKKISWVNYYLFRKKLAQEGQLFLCVSHFIRDLLIKMNFPEDKLLTHYIGIDTDAIKPTPERKTENIILHVARLVEKKGTAYLLKALAILKNKKIDTTLVIIGDGPLLASLKKLAMTLNIQDQVLFLGVQARETVIDWMQKSTVFCLPSIQASSGDSEALGMVILEAFACQLPVVATQHGGIPEVIQNEVSGLLVPEKDERALADRLAYLLTHDTIREKMGLTAREVAVEHFNLKKQTIKLEKIYQSLL